MATAITNFDIHDIARCARTFGVEGFFIITPLESQVQLAERIIRHWVKGFGSVYNPTRKESLSLVRVSRPHFDYSRIPIELNQGENLLIFRYARGGMKVRLVPVAKPVAYNAKDLTIPDVIVGAATDAWGGIPVINSTGAALKGYALICRVAGGKGETVDVPVVPAMGVRKLAFKIKTAARKEKGSIPVHLELVDRASGKKAAVDTVTLMLRVVGPEEVRRETFVSDIDGSVQYYAVTPQDSAGFRERPALFLSLHGAGVEAFNQANSYAPKKWGVVVAATNRRPYGFSWEDWGRMDALEVLAIAITKDCERCRTQDDQSRCKGCRGRGTR